VEKIKEAEAFLIERENKLCNIQNSRLATEKVPDSFARGKVIMLYVLIR